MKATRKILIFLLVAIMTLGLLSLTVSAATVESEGGDIYDDDYEYESMFSEAGARIYLAVVGALLGIALPAVPLTIFLLKLVRKKEECELIDYIVLTLSVLWLAVGITLFVFVL